MEQRAHIIRISPLELTMRDVREGLADFSSEFGFASTPDAFELLAIEPPGPADLLPRRAAKVHQIRDTR